MDAALGASAMMAELLECAGRANGCVGDIVRGWRAGLPLHGPCSSDQPGGQGLRHVLRSMARTRSIPRGTWAGLDGIRLEEGGVVVLTAAACCFPVAGRAVEEYLLEGGRRVSSGWPVCPLW